MAHSSPGQLLSPGSSSHSPMQRVPYIEGLSLSDDPFEIEIFEGGPYLHIDEEPDKMFRFRYKSEMAGTHGCLTGCNSGPRGKTYPSVKLMNYPQEAKVVCSLARAEGPGLHPHRLVVRHDDQDVDDPHEVQVGPQRGFIAQFRGMAIIHTSKKKIARELFLKHRKQILRTLSTQEEREMQSECEQESYNINLNSVRLCFEAYDMHNNPLPCSPVYSSCIDNLKSAETGALKITRMSKTVGECTGGDEIFILVEKVSKKNIKVRFYENEKESQPTWEAFGIFTELDVHHQFALVIRTPPYRDKSTAKDVDVFMQLYRPKDGAVSEPRNFRYKATPRLNKRRRQAETSLTSLLSSEASLHSLSSTELPANLAAFTAFPQTVNSNAEFPEQSLITGHDANPDMKLGEIDKYLKDFDYDFIKDYASTFSLHNLDSFEGLGGLGAMEGMEELCVMNQLDNLGLGGLTQPLQHFGGLAVDAPGASAQPCIKEENSMYNVLEMNQAMQVLKLMEACREDSKNPAIDRLSHALLNKLEEKLDEGDSFLHMFAAIGNIKALTQLLELVEKRKLHKVLNDTNNQGETALHKCVIFSRHLCLPRLLLAGCDPNLRNTEGNTPLHLTVLLERPECMVQLLNPDNYRGTRNLHLDILNNDGQAPLHLAAARRSVSLASRLLQAGAPVMQREAREQRSALHIAASRAQPMVASYLLDYAGVEVDALTASGCSALHLACVSPDPNAELVCRALLRHGADPHLKRNRQSPLDLAMKNKNTKVADIIKSHIASHAEQSDSDPEVKKEPLDVCPEETED